MAGKLVDSLDEDFDPDDYEDTYRDAVLDLIKRKARARRSTSPRRRSPSTATT